MGMLKQDYPAYSLHIVIDSADDPACEVVTTAIAEGQTPRAEVHVALREELSEYCSVKLSSQRQVLTRLDDRVEVVVFLDADSVPSVQWLRAMVAPFGDPQVGATSGIRWSAPQDEDPGTLVRHIFNALGFPQMYLLCIPWGGSLAVRKDVLHKARLIEYWSRCFCEDTSAFGPIRDLGLRLAFVPAATQVNHESTNLAGAYQFILRQLVCVRLHHVYWRQFLAFNVAAMISFLVCCALAAVGVVSALLCLLGWSTELWKLTALALIPAIYVAGAMMTLSAGEWLVERVTASRPPVTSLRRRAWGLLLTLYFTTLAMFTAWRARSIGWRGITYDIEGRDRIRMRAYRPYCTSGGEAVSIRSVL
jgi:cellulose synthase/poly-beta-1,6-N-acetylglucosamine synthase-like glycosyltransferase